MQITVVPLSPSPLFPRLNISQASLQVGKEQVFGFGIDLDAAWSRQLAVFECAERSVGYHTLAKTTDLKGDYDEEMEFIPDAAFSAVVNSEYKTYPAGETALLPELLVLGPSKLRSINSVPSHGLALHANVTDAVSHGASEWYERHAFFKFWYSGGSVIRNEDADSVFDRLGLAPYPEYQVSSYSLEQIGTYFISMAILHSKRGFMVGLGASTNRLAAIEKAIKEVALFYGYWLTYLENKPVRIAFKTFNDHLNWFWHKGGDILKLLDERMKMHSPAPSAANKVPNTFFSVIWEGSVQGLTCIVVRTRVPGFIPQHSAGIVPLRAGRKLDIAPNSNLVRLNGIHPFS